MKPPICRVCGKAEWNHVCRSSLDEVRAAIPKPEPRKEVMSHSPGKPAGMDNATAPVKAGADPPKFDRTAYQREYMRRRRAKA